MKKLVTGLSFLAVLTSSMVAADGWQAGASYTTISGDSDNTDISLGLAVASLGYEFNSGKFSTIPELKLGTGIKDDDVTILGTRVDVEADRFASLGVKFQYQATDRFYIYAAPSYANLKLSASAGGVSESDDDWDWGAGVGAGYQLSQNLAFDIGYDRYDDTDVVHAGIRYTF